MDKDNKVHIYNRLFFKLYFNYAVMLLITAVLICLIYMNLYQKYTLQNNQEEMKNQAINISRRMKDFVKDGKPDKALEYLYDTMELYNNKGDKKKSYNNKTMDISTYSKPDAKVPMGDSYETGESYQEIVSSKKYADSVDIVGKAFHNVIAHVTKYDKISQVPTVSVAVPIYGINGEVAGCVVLKKQVQEVKNIISKSIGYVVVSSVVALAISFIMIIVFATKLSLPITRMRSTALELAAGNYHSKTGIKRNDEIGDLACTVDILSEKLLENDIERKNLDQMRLDFFANVSHELRTPITVMRAYTETLVDGVVTDEDKVAEYYKRMLTECKSMERLVGDLLLLSKMQNPDFAIEKEPVNLMQIFEDIMRSASAIAEKKHITIEVNNDAPMYMMLGDYDRLRQMFMVILDNAIKFSNENKTVHINLSKMDKIRVSIRDEGIGIEASDLPNIFQKFYKSNLRQNASGTGLGLAIARQIALKHGGTIDVESTKGVGTEFIFTFPPYEINDEIF